MRIDPSAQTVTYTMGELAEVKQSIGDIMAALDEISDPNEKVNIKMAVRDLRAALALKS